MKKLFPLLLLTGLLLQAPFSYAEKNPRALVRALLQNPVGKSIPPDVQQALKELSPAQLAQVTAQLQRANAQLARQNAQTRAFQTELFETTRPAIFRALPSAKRPRPKTFYEVNQNGETEIYWTVANSLTGTVFEIETDGKTEIFGIVPMHGLKDVFHTPGLLSYKFTAVVEHNGTIHKIPARVVQLSSDKTADVALVKFEEKDRALLSPLRLAPNTPLSVGTRLYVQGYACNLPAHGIATVSGHTSAGLVTTHIPASRRGDRAGFCGSPLVTENKELAGIHVGSLYTDAEKQSAPSSTMMPGKDLGYMSPVSYVYALVEAYHHPGKAVIPVKIRGQEITRLAANEYVSWVALLDEKREPLRIYATQFKMSMRLVEKDLSVLPQARWIRFHIGKTHWQKNKEGWYVLDDDYLHRDLLAEVPPLP